MERFKESILTLVTDTSTNLPPDIRKAIVRASKTEKPGTRSSLALETIATNIDMACDFTGPICQDTGMPTFYIHTPVGANQIRMKKDILDAVVEATKAGTLRENSVDSLTGKNSGNNLGPGTPVFHWEQWENENEIEVKLILKGGGCENKNIQYSLPEKPVGTSTAYGNVSSTRCGRLRDTVARSGHSAFPSEEIGRAGTSRQNSNSSGRSTM